jgi:hypothetical protein
LVSYRGPSLEVKGPITNALCAGQVEIQRGFRMTLVVWWCGCERRIEARQPSCYKFRMPKTVEQWFLFEYVGLEFTPLSKAFKTREQAEKAREKYPERLRKRIGLGVIRIKR